MSTTAKFNGAQGILEVERTAKGCFCPTCGLKLPARLATKDSKPMTPAQRQKATAKFYAMKAKLLKQAEALGLNPDALFPDTFAAEPAPLHLSSSQANALLDTLQGAPTSSGTILAKDLAQLKAGLPVPFTPSPKPKPKGLAAIHQASSRVAHPPSQEQDPQLF